MYKFLFVFFLFTNYVNSQQDTFRYRAIGYQRHFKEVELSDLISIPQILFTNSPSNNTKVINAYLKKNRAVKLPNINIIVDSTGVTLNDDNILFFDKNSSLTMKPNGLIRYEVLRIHSIKNVEVYNPNIIGDREHHLRKEGEWGHGISILSANNIKIYNYKVEKCWGDGVYIGKIKGSLPSNNIYLENGVLDYNRRNGFSITSGININTNGLISANTYGTLPMYGLDIEPNGNDDDIDNIVFKNFKSINNSEGGTQIAIQKLLGKNEKKVDIYFLNYEDEFSKIGLFFGGVPINSGINGSLLMDNIELINNLEPIKSRNNNDNQRFNFSIDNLKVVSTIEPVQLKNLFKMKKINVTNLKVLGDEH